MLRGGYLLLCVFGRRAGAFAEVEMGAGYNRVGDEKGVGCERHRDSSRSQHLEYSDREMFK